MDTNQSQTKNLFAQRSGEICINNEFKWAIDGIELRGRMELEIQIGGHWIYGFVTDSDRGMFWSSWREGVAVPITVGLKARRPEKPPEFDRAFLDNI